MEVIVHLCRGRPRAGTNALNLFQRELPVRRRTLVRNAESLLAVLKKLLRPPQLAADIGANLDVVAPARFGREHRVIRNDVPDFQFRQPNFLGDVVNGYVAQISELVLGVEQYGNEKRPLRRVILHLLAEKTVELFRNWNHLSISPSTMSIDPIAATTSAISRPSHIAGSACKCASDGARTCTRQGLAVPSLTT